MNGLVLLLLSAAFFLAAYVFYGRWIAKKWGIDPGRKTPAVEYEDGVDYVPAEPNVVFGHHFASIAGVGPINGPIVAAMFGWVPVLLWILIGGVFFGAVHDFASLYASIRSKGKTIGYIIEMYIGKVGKRLFLLFTWLFSILVVAAFADIVAGTFNGFTVFNEELIKNTANGSAATTSMAFIFIAVAFGFFMRKAKTKSLTNSIVAIVLLTVCLALGILFPVYISSSAWVYIVLIYAFLASVTPVWALLQPRDLMNSFLMVGMIFFAFFGIVLNVPSINIPAFTGFKVGNNYLFPILFVTVACGAISGFHSLVASGTVSKQLNNEKYMTRIGFGSMLVESMLAVIALITVAAITVHGTLPAGVSTPPQIFAYAISGFLSIFKLPSNIIYGFLILCISSFALTSLDTVARIGRLAFQELFSDAQNEDREPSRFVKIVTNKFVATAITIILCYSLAKVGYMAIWPLFGSANQMLAALALVACSVFLKRTKRQGFMLWIPMIVMMAITFTALGITIMGKINLIAAGTFSMSKDFLQLLFGLLLFGLGIMVAFQGIVKLREKVEDNK